MPDGTYDCGLIMGELKAIRETLAVHGEVVKREIDLLKEGLDEANESIKKIEIARATEAGQISGATWALAKIGAVAMALFAAVGWVMTNGFPTWIKKALGA